MATLDVNELVKEMRTAVSGVAKKDLETVSGYSDRQLEAIAAQGEGSPRRRWPARSAPGSATSSSTI